MYIHKNNTNELVVYVLAVYNLTAEDIWNCFSYIGHNS